MCLGKSKNKKKRPHGCINYKANTNCRECMEAARQAEIEAEIRTAKIYPVPTPRKHGKGCALELALLEKHSHTCRHKKCKNPFAAKDDKVGSYIVVGRVTYEMCARRCKTTPPIPVNMNPNQPMNPNQVSIPGCGPPPAGGTGQKFCEICCPDPPPKKPPPC